VFALIGAIRDSKVGRTLVVGGLDVALVRPVTSRGLPLAYKAEAGKSRVPLADFAGALAGEIRRPARIRARFTVGY
jgi:putative NADH-flavin reductase